jgi:hypothetical protein
MKLTHEAEYICECEIWEEPVLYPVAELIRCKDCKFRYTDGESVTANYCLLNHNRVMADDWFCADAEREEE